MSKTLIDLKISHKEFETIVNENEKYDQIKESIRYKKDGVNLVKMHKLMKKNIFFVCIIKWLLSLLKNMQMQEFIK